MNVITRNLTNIYLDQRRSFAIKNFKFNKKGGPNNDAGDKPLLDHEIHSKRLEIQMISDLPPTWIDLIEELQEEVVKIKDKVYILHKAQQKRLLLVFDESNTTQLDDEIQLLSQSITNMLKRADERTRHLTNIQTNTQKTETHLRRNAQKIIATTLQTLSQTFRKQQQNFINELKRKQAPMELIEQPPVDMQDNAESQHMMLLERDLSSRNEELQKLTESLESLQTVFKDLSIMVVEQGTILDCIDYNMELVVHKTEETKKNLQIAQRRQSNSFSRTLILILLAINAFLILLHILKGLI